MMVSVRIVGKVPPPFGGVTTHILRLYQWLLRYPGVDVKLSILNEGDCGCIEERVDSYVLWSLYHCVFGFKEDIVHYQGSNYYGLVILSLIRKVHRNTKLIWSIHSEYSVSEMSRGFLFRAALRNIDCIVSDNNNIKQQLFDVGYDRSIVISPFLMPVDYSAKTEKTPLLSRYFMDGVFSIIFNAYKVVFNSDGEDVYGLDTLVEAFPHFNKKINLVLMIPDFDMESVKYFHALLRKNGVLIDDPRIILLTNNKEIDGWRCIQQASLLVRPTRTDGDALSVREALYMGVPAVVSNCTERPKGVTLFETEDALDLATTVNSLFEKDSIFEIKNSDVKKNINKFVGLYERMASH